MGNSVNLQFCRNFQNHQEFMESLQTKIQESQLQKLFGQFQNSILQLNQQYQDEKLLFAMEFDYTQYLMFNSKRYLLFSSEALYFVDDKLTPIKRLQFSQMKKVISIDINQQVILITYNLEFVEGILIRSQKEARQAIQIFSQNFNQIYDSIQIYYQLNTKMFLDSQQIKDAKIELEFDFSEANQLIYRKFLQRIENLKGFITEADEKLIMIYKVQKISDQGTVKRLIALTNKRLINFSQQKGLNFRNDIQINHILEIWLCFQKDCFAVFTNKFQNFFLTSQSEEICLVLQQIFKKNMASLLQVKLLDKKNIIKSLQSTQNNTLKSGFTSQSDFLQFSQENSPLKKSSYLKDKYVLLINPTYNIDTNNYQMQEQICNADVKQNQIDDYFSYKDSQTKEIKQKFNQQYPFENDFFQSGDELKPERFFQLAVQRLENYIKFIDQCQLNQD